MNIKGIDVSKYQGSINWAEVKNTDVKFAMLRVGTGYAGGSKDTKFEENCSNAKAVNLPIGAYYYTYATTEKRAVEDAELVLNWLNGKKFEYPIIYDVEEKSQFNLGKEKLSAIIKAFCEKMEQAGYYVGIYANKNFLENVIDDECKKRYDVWLAQWSSKPTYQGNFGMWQYTSDGSVNGINGRVDMNIAYKDYPQIIKSNGLNGYGKEAVTPKPQPQPEEKPTPPTPPSPTQAVYGKDGDTLNLNNTPLYASSTATNKANSLTGTFYIWGNEVLSGRIRITNSKSNVRKAGQVTGYINITDLNVSAPSTPNSTPPTNKFAVGAEVKLVKQKLYTASTGKTGFIKTKTYYIYDGKKINGRYRVTNNKKNCGKKPLAMYVSGWVEI